MSNNYDWSLIYLPYSVSSIVEVGSRDALDAIRLSEYFGCKVISFEPNPKQFEICSENLENSGNKLVELRSEALSNESSTMNFLVVDESKYDNTGSSSFFEIDFTNRGRMTLTSIEVQFKNR